MAATVRVSGNEEETRPQETRLISSLSVTATNAWA